MTYPLDTAGDERAEATCLCIGITGGSGSGKTTFTSLLEQRLADLSPAILHQDRYFRDWLDVPEAEREARRTANHPDALAWPAFLAHFAALRRGEAVQEPAPGTRANVRSQGTATVGPSAVLVVEGLFALWHPSLREQLDLRIYMDAPDDERALRRMLRDVDRGGNLDRAAAWYRRDVLPNFSQYTGASRQFAHLIIPWLDHNGMAVSVVVDWVRGELARRSAAAMDER